MKTSKKDNIEIITNLIHKRLIVTQSEIVEITGINKSMVSSICIYFIPGLKCLIIRNGKRGYQPKFYHFGELNQKKEDIIERFLKE